MLNKMRNRQGFTLIELLIVVAIIGILAAVAIPQFATYRMKGFNSAALSDLKNAKTAEESMMTDVQRYGMPQTGKTLAAQVVATAGAVTVTGPQGAATASTEGLAFGNLDAADNPAGVGFGLSNSVIFQGEVDAAVATAYILATRHTQGETCFAVEHDDTAVLKVTNAAWVGTTDINAKIPTPPAQGAQINGTGGGGNPVVNWAVN